MQMPQTAIKQFASGFFHRHQDKLWWFHSSYSLLLGVGVMWLGTKNFTYLRLAVFHIAFIWLSSLGLPMLTHLQSIPEHWQRRLRLLINYFQRNFYQQLLFFILPIYYISATWGAANMLFVLLLAFSALLATMDIIYDRYLTVKKWLPAVFFAFNLFACINVMLPVVWNFRNFFALRLSALLALAGFASFSFAQRGVKIRDRLLSILVVALLLAGISEIGRPLIPPAPLSLLEGGFGLGWDEQKNRLSERLSELPDSGPIKIFAMSAIGAPFGLKDRISHRWYLDGQLVYTSPLIKLSGGRKNGFRLWTFRTFNNISAASILRVDISTAAGQLIGRVRLRGTASG